MISLPPTGKPVLVVNGAYRGLRAVLESLDTEHFCASIKIDQVRLMCHVLKCINELHAGFLSNVLVISRYQVKYTTLPNIWLIAFGWNVVDKVGFFFGEDGHILLQRHRSEYRITVEEWVV